MTEKVDADKIEGIVGVPRHARAHWARAVSEEEMVYILHSKNCLEDNTDLRWCEFSLALNNGIDMDEWPLDQPVVVRVDHGILRPAVIGT